MIFCPGAPKNVAIISSQKGNTHKRKLYAETLRKIADDEDTFYSGKLAHKIIKDLRKQGSKMTAEDLKQYK